MFEDDIPMDVAKAAHAGTSFDPDTRGVQERAAYANTLANDRTNLLKFADTDEKRATLETEFARYREGYKARTLKYLASKSRCLSTMIAGPSNFPTRRNAKRSDVADKRLTELVDYRERALAAIRRALRPEDAPIMTGDVNAGERLAHKIAAAEKRQAGMKKINAAIRKHAKAGTEAQVAALIALGFVEVKARELLKPDFLGRVGFADYEIKNNNANIRRMKSRLVEVARVKTMPDATTEGTAARIEDCPAENRIRLFFPGKPDAAIRDRLKRSGFRWTPTLGCWQAFRNLYAQDIAKEIAGA